MEYEIWTGNKNKYIDQIEVKANNGVTIGCYGGCSRSGATTNEDAYLVLPLEDNSKFVILLDARVTNESALLILDEIKTHIDEISLICNKPVYEAIPELQLFIIELISNEDFLEKCKYVIGESAILFCFQKAEFLWWLSVGDNSLYVFHDEFNKLGQYKLNQRIFYQWIGEKNSLDLAVPCYSSGTIQLRSGLSKIVLLTDGVLDLGNRIFDNDKELLDRFNQADEVGAILSILDEVKIQKGRDSATILTWSVNLSHSPLIPTRY